MPEANDMDLLRDYSRHGTEAAFVELVATTYENIGNPDKPKLIH